jgi:hypothetical protein
MHGQYNVKYIKSKIFNDLEFSYTSLCFSYLYQNMYKEFWFRNIFYDVIIIGMLMKIALSSMYNIRRWPPNA